MRLRPLVNILAMLGVLAHAGALVRHNIIMVGAQFEYSALLSDLSSICHSNSSDETFGADFPRGPLPTNSKDACSICLGLLGTVALIVAQVVGVPTAIEMKRPRFSIIDAMVEVPRALHPPPRGPPARA